MALIRFLPPNGDGNLCKVLNSHSTKVTVTGWGSPDFDSNRTKLVNENPIQITEKARSNGTSTIRIATAIAISIGATMLPSSSYATCVISDESPCII